MNSEFQTRLFSETEEFFSSRGLNVLHEDIDGRDILVLEPHSSDTFDDCNISVNETDEQTAAVDMLFTLGAELDSELCDSLDELLLYLNKFLTIGSFGLEREGGYFYFGCSYLADTAAPTEQMMKVFLMTWQIAADTAVQGVGILQSLKGGEVQLSELLNDDTSIIQLD